MVNNQGPKDSRESFEKALQESHTDRYVLRLYIAGNTKKSAEAILNLRNLCEEHLQGRYQLEIIDISQQPSIAKREQIIATPTLVKTLPPPLRRVIGDLSKKDRLLLGLDLVKLEK